MSYSSLYRDFSFWHGLHWLFCMQQTSFFKSKSRREHGGILSVGRRRDYRPLSIKEPLHVTLRSDHATGPRSLLAHRKMIVSTLRKWEYRFGVRVYEYAICGNHLHLLIRGKTRVQIQNFFRVVAGHIAQNILREFPLPKAPGGGTARGVPGGAPGAGSKLCCKKNRRVFWALLLYSRIVTWGREYRTVRRYIVQNTLEALNLIAYKPRRSKKHLSSS